MSKPQEIETAEFELLISPSASETSVPKPATRSVHVEFGSVSHTGKVRSHNEDHFLVSRYSRKQEVLQTNLPQNCLPEHNGDDGYLFIVADGMGGMAAGEVASRVAISTSLKLLHRSERWGFKVNHREARELFNQINRDLQEVDKTLTEQSAADRRLLGMGTTLTAAYTMGVDLFVVHLGDSRAYLYRDGTLRQLTKDHTVAQAMADAGHISHESVRHHAKRNALTNFLGGHNGKVKADLRWLRLADGDRLLLCSDGLNEMVDDVSIGRILGQRDTSRDTTNLLLNEALRRGGKDNVTVIVADYRIPSVPTGKQQKDQERSPMLESTSDSHHPSMIRS
ncbi:MAG: PP2C family protein-serine/threonine phosphatase [Isosphaeraceae bacterium]